MSERDFDKGYKSGFQFGKEVANEKWLNKVKQAREEIEALPVYNTEIERPNSTVYRDVIEIDRLHRILDKLIAESEVDNG